jgi:hypothetical protein
MGGQAMISAVFIYLGVVMFFIGAFLLWLPRQDEMDHVSKNGLTEPSVSEPRDTPTRVQIVSRIFSREDRQFILLTHSPRLCRMYRKERSQVALHWVLGISSDVNRIMRAHRLGSRQSRNLEVGAETNILLQYLKLRFLCGLLILMIKALGPHALGDIAIRVNNLYLGIGRLGSVGNPVAITGRTGGH